jgi:bifunctional non-homologous end joining protein LigD
MKLPRISPLTLTRKREPFDHPDWVFELKHDGFRGVAYISDCRCQLVSRKGNVYKSFKTLCKSLETLRVKDAILDGEIVCLNEEGTSIFNRVMFRLGLQHFYAFDLLWLNGKDLRDQPLIKRKERLRKLIMRADNPALLFADHVDNFGTDFFRMVCEKNLEGIVAKHRASPYSKSAKWIKIKNPNYTQSERRHELFNRE